MLANIVTSFHSDAAVAYKAPEPSIQRTLTTDPNPLDTTFSRESLSREVETPQVKSHHHLPKLDKVSWAKLNFFMNVVVCGCSVAAIVLHSMSGNYGAVAAMSGATVMNVVMGYANLQRINGADI